MIKIICFNTNSISPCNFIANISGEIYKSKNQNIQLKAVKNKCYKINVYNEQKVIYYTGQDILVTFVFNCYNYKRVILLTDKNYQGLPIKKGEIKLNGIQY